MENLENMTFTELLNEESRKGCTCIISEDSTIDAYNKYEEQMSEEELVAFAK